MQIAYLTMGICHLQAVRELVALMTSGVPKADQMSESELLRKIKRKYHYKHDHNGKDSAKTTGVLQHPAELGANCAACILSVLLKVAWPGISAFLHPHFERIVAGRF